MPKSGSKISRPPAAPRPAPAPDRRTARTLRAYYDALLRHFGPLGWWPAETSFEVAVGAILTQNTAWTNVEKAIRNLKTARLLDANAILTAPPELLENALRPSGYFRVKARRLRSYCEYLVERYGGDMSVMSREPLETLRPELLNIHGIGPETADDILLYACGKPVFVVDAYTRRIFARHGLVPKGILYEPLRNFFETLLPPDVEMYKEFHAQIVYAAKDYCRAKPSCDGCPLRRQLPVEGPVL